MDPVWMLFSRRTFSRLAYWLLVLGYDLRDSSASNRIYLVYFCAFWAVWAIAVFALLGSGLAGLFGQMEISSPPLLVVTLAGYAFIIWALALFWQVSRRSPFVFSEEDAYLLCQAPVNHRKVVLLWFVQGTLATAMPFAAAIVIISFGLAEWRLQDESILFLILDYLKASLWALLLLLPVQIGVQAALWGLGARRLHHPKELTWPRPVFFGAILWLVAASLFPALRSLLLAPLTLPLQAAFLESAPIAVRWAGLALGSLCLGAGGAVLYSQAEKINLSRAAQETRHIAAVGLARSYGQFDLVDSMLSRRRLGETRPPSRLLARRPGNPLFWKDLLQSIRAFQLRELANPVWIFGLSLAMFSASNWALQIVLAGVWTISLGGLATRRLRNDLARWWLLRSLPLSPEEILIKELYLSAWIYTLLGWLALAFSNVAWILRLYAAVLLPFLVASAALGAARDILRHSKARVLMSPSLAEENVPRQNIGGVVQALISVLIPFGVLTWSFAHPEQAAYGLAAFPIAALIWQLNRRAAVVAYRWIE